MLLKQLELLWLHPPLTHCYECLTSAAYQMTPFTSNCSWVSGPIPSLLKGFRLLTHAAPRQPPNEVTHAK